MVPGQFELPLIYQLIAVFLLAITGAMLALEKKYDVSGVFVLALIAGASGGIIRDGMFLATIPVIVQQWQYLAAIILAVIVSLIFISYIKRFATVFVAIDALGLGLFGIVSTQMALDSHLNILAAIFIGVVGAVSGGFLRDILTQTESLLLKPGQYYISAVLAGIILFLFLAMYVGIHTQVAIIAGIGITFVIRMLSFTFNWQTAPAITISEKLFHKKEKQT
jgi:uncharacterized membrane protein YeiH